MTELHHMTYDALLSKAHMYKQEVEALRAQAEALKDFAGHAYIFFGAHDAPEQWLDVAFAAASDKDFTTEGLLPYAPSAQAGEVETLRQLVRHLTCNPKFDFSALDYTTPQPQGDASPEPEPESLHERVEHYAALVKAFQDKMRAVGPLTPPEDIALSGLIAAARATLTPRAHEPDDTQLLGGPNCRRIGDYIVNIDGNSIVVSQGRRLVISHTDEPAPTVDGGEQLSALWSNVHQYEEAHEGDLGVALQALYDYTTHPTPAPDVARLVEALREIVRRMPADKAGYGWIAKTIAQDALNTQPEGATNEEFISEESKHGQE